MTNTTQAIIEANSGKKMRLSDWPKGMYIIGRKGTVYHVDDAKQEETEFKIKDKVDEKTGRKENRYAYNPLRSAENWEEYNEASHGVASGENKVANDNTTGSMTTSSASDKAISAIFINNKKEKTNTQSVTRN